jgi:hypothetical protein
MPLWSRVATLALLAWLTGTAIAQEDTVRQRAEYSAIAQTAARLVSYGEAKGDALALLAAARMIATLPVSLESAGQSAVLDVDTIVRKAETIAPGDRIIARIADDIRATESGNTKGLRCQYDEICYSNGYCEYWITC